MTLMTLKLKPKLLMEKPKLWTLDEARQLVNDVQEDSREFGYHVALGGGVLNHGESNKDVDLYFLPLDTPDIEKDPEGLLRHLEQQWGSGFPITDPHYMAQSAYAHKIKFTDNKRIDAFIL